MTITAAEALATCHFCDVGQGTCQIIELRDGRILVLDGGRSPNLARRLVKRFGDRISLLVVSHNDSDHHHGALGLLEDDTIAIDKICFLEDREFDHIGLYARVQQLVQAGRLTVQRLERDHPKKASPLFEDSTQDVYLDLLYPTFLENLEGRKTGEPNATCGVLLLYCGQTRVLFSGDASLWAWRRLHDRLGGPVDCDVMTIPHHGGIIWDNSSDSAPQLDWFYTQATRFQHAIVSVGSHNSHEHPRTEVFDALHRTRNPTPSILCTQITERCCTPAHLQRLDTQTRARGLLHPRTAKGVPCAGTVVVYLGKTAFTIDRHDDHQDWINTLRAEEASPRCLPPLSQAS